MNEKNILFRKALDLAENIGYNVSPRPPVGAIITLKGKIIGEGVTTIYPLKHAEINAIENAKKKIKSLQGCVLYSTLEPCFHTGHTGPCVDKIIESGINKIIIGSIDPNPEVNMKSIDKLKIGRILYKIGSS